MTFKKLRYLTVVSPLNGGQVIILGRKLVYLKRVEFQSVDNKHVNLILNNISIFKNIQLLFLFSYPISSLSNNTLSCTYKSLPKTMFKLAKEGYSGSFRNVTLRNCFVYIPKPKQLHISY